MSSTAVSTWISKPASTSASASSTVARSVRPAPTLAPASIGEAYPLAMGEVPDEVGTTALQQVGGTEVVGGTQGGDGTWQVIVMAPGAAGVARPVSVAVPAA